MPLDTRPCESLNMNRVCITDPAQGTKLGGVSNYLGGTYEIGPAVHTKKIPGNFCLFLANNIWSYLPWPPVVCIYSTMPKSPTYERPVHSILCSYSVLPCLTGFHHISYREPETLSKVVTGSSKGVNTGGQAIHTRASLKIYVD